MNTVPVRNPLPSVPTNVRRGVWVAPCSTVSLFQPDFGFLDQHHNFAVLGNLLNAMVNPARCDAVAEPLWRAGGCAGERAVPWSIAANAPCGSSGRGLDRRHAADRA